MAEDTRVGTELAGYRIDRVIGRGGMSVVYLAEHARLERKVALKLLAPELADSERFRDRFLRESRLAASIDHPNIVPIYDADEADGTLFIAMRYVEGSDLKEVIRSEGRIDLARTSAIVGQVASALDAAHALDLVHRDVKPSNVLLTPDDHVYVSDFGLTKRALSVSGLTATGQLVGTIDYVAPEHIKGDPIDRRADVYSLGCMVVECLTGHAPYPRDLEVGVLWAHVEEEPPKVTEERPDLSPEIDGVVAAAMAKDPDARTATAGEVAAGLRSTLGSDGATVVAPSRPRRKQPRGRRRTALIAALVGLGVLVAVGVAVLLAGRGDEVVVAAANSIARIDAEGTAFSTSVEVGQDPTGVAIGEDGDLWVINQGDSTVSRIDPESGDATSPKSTLGIPTGVAAGAGAVWITNGFGGPSGTGQVVRLDLTDESVEPAFPSGNAKAIVVAFGSIWLADADRDVVLRYDPQDLDAPPVEIATDEDPNASAAPRSLSVGTGAAEGIWVANELGDTVVRIDPETDEVAEPRIQVESPSAVAADDSGVWVTSEIGDRVVRFDAIDGRTLKTYQTADGVLDGPTAIVIAPDGVWFGSVLEPAIARLDPETDAIDRVAIDGITGGLVVDANGDLWVAVRSQTV